MGMRRLAGKRHSSLVVSKGSLGQRNKKNVEMQFILGRAVSGLPFVKVAV